MFIHTLFYEANQYTDGAHKSRRSLYGQFEYAAIRIWLLIWRKNIFQPTFKRYGYSEFRNDWILHNNHRDINFFV